MSSDLTRARWFTSSYSNGNNHECVEVALLGGPQQAVAVRDSKNRSTSPILHLSPAGWTAFLDAVKHGEFAG